MKLRDLLKSVAPTLAGVVGAAVGVPPPITAIAIKVLSEKLLHKPDATVEELETHINGMTPEALVQLRTIDTDFRIRMVALGYRLDELEVEDRKDARAMQVAALAQSDPFAKRFIYYLAMFWSVVSVIYIFSVTFYPYPDEQEQIVYTVLGFLLGTAISTIFNFFFGTSFSERGARKFEDRMGTNSK